MENQSYELNVSPRRAAWVLLAFAAAITIFSLVGKYLTLFSRALRSLSPLAKYAVENYFIRQFQTNAQSNAVIYFTAFILLAESALCFLLIGLQKRRVQDRFYAGWLALAGLSFFLSMYVAAALPDKHVKFYYLGWTTRNGWFLFRWAATALTLILLALAFRKFLASLEGRTKTLLPLAVLTYFVGLFGMEIFSKRYAAFFAKETPALVWAETAGEALMFGGLILLLYAALDYMARNMPQIRFDLRKNPTGEESVQPVRPARVFWILTAVAALFAGLSFIGQVFRLSPNSYSINTPLEESLLDIFIFQFDVNTEANLATHFNTLLLVLAAALLLILAALKFRLKDKYRWGWLILGLFALYLSIDEQCVLHEKLGKFFEGWSSYGGWLEYKWLIPALFGVGALAILFIPFFFHLENRFKILFVVAVAMYLSGAFGGEMFSGRWASVHGVKNIVYSTMTTFEEMLEFSGINLLIYSLLHYMEIYFGQVALKVEEKSKPQ